MITNEILVKNTLNIKPNTLEDYTINIMDMLGVDIDYSSMFKEKNKIVDKSTGKVVCERKIVSADTFIKLKSKYSDGYRMPYEIYIFDEIILGVIYSNKGGVVFKSYKNSKTLASFYDKENFDRILKHNNPDYVWSNKDIITITILVPSTSNSDTNAQLDAAPIIPPPVFLISLSCS